MNDNFSFDAEDTFEPGPEPSPEFFPDPSSARFPGAGLLESLRDAWQVDDLAAMIGQENQARITIAGLNRVGKRRLYNRLRGGVIEWPDHQADPEDEPRLDRLGLFVLADLPAWGTGGGHLDVLLQTPQALLVALDDPALIVYLLDAEQGISQSDYRWIAALRTTGRPLVVALNKCDLLEGGMKGVDTAVADVQRAIGLPVIAISALTGLNVEDGLLPAMLDAAPRLAVPLGREITKLRRHVARRVMKQSALFAAMLGLQPVPGLELPFLISLHLGLVWRVGAAYGYQTGGGVGREVIATVGAVVALQYGAQTAAKFVPVLGSAVGGVLSALATFLIGETAIRFYEAGATIPLTEMKASLRSRLSFKGWRRSKRTIPVTLDEAEAEEILIWPVHDRAD